MSSSSTFVGSGAESLYLDNYEPEGFLEYDIDSQGGVELDAYIPPDVEEDGDEASGM